MKPWFGLSEAEFKAAKSPTKTDPSGILSRQQKADSIWKQWNETTSIAEALKLLEEHHIILENWWRLTSNAVCEKFGYSLVLTEESQARFDGRSSHYMGTVWIVPNTSLKFRDKPSALQLIRGLYGI